MWKTLLTLAAVVVVALAAATLLRREPPLVVDTVRVARGDLAATLELTGTLTNDRTVALTALLDGEIVHIGAREGEIAEAGAILAELDAREPAARLAEARATLALARARLAAARASHERVTTMSASVSPQSVEDSALALDEAIAELAVAESAVEVARLRLDNATVRAPFTGTVTERDAEVGQWIEAGTRLFVLVAREGQTVEAEVDASDFARVALGQRATLSTEAAPERPWTGTLDWIAPAITPRESGGDTFAVRVSPGEDAPPLLIGQRLDVDLELERRADVAYLPLAALREDGAGDWSALVLEDDVARRRTVEVGLVTLERAEIVGGLAPGSRVIVPFGERPAAGEPVVARER